MIYIYILLYTITHSYIYMIHREYTGYRGRGGRREAESYRIWKMGVEFVTSCYSFWNQVVNRNGYLNWPLLETVYIVFFLTISTRCLKARSYPPNSRHYSTETQNTRAKHRSSMLAFTENLCKLSSLMLGFGNNLCNPRFS